MALLVAEPQPKLSGGGADIHDLEKNLRLLIYSINQLPRVLGSDTKLLFRSQKYYSEQEQ